MKNFLKQWNPKALKKMSKDDRTDLLYECIPSLVSDYIKKGHQRPDEVTELFNRMEENDKFITNLLRILKTHDEGDPVTPVDLGMATIIADFLAQRHGKLSEEMVESYNKAINKILKKRIKKGVKKTGLEKDLVKELLVVVSEPDAISNPKFMGIYVHRVLNKLYALARETNVTLEADTVKKLFKFLFGKESLNEVAVNVLLEYRDKFSKFNQAQQTVWNTVTQFALDTLEGNEKKEIRDLLEYYCSRRKKNENGGNDRARRIQFAAINAEDYPRLTKAVKKLSDNEELAKYLA